MTTDAVVTMGRSVIQHGPFSDRVYLMKFHPSDLPHLVDTIEELGDRHGYGKLFVKLPASAALACSILSR